MSRGFFRSALVAVAGVCCSWGSARAQGRNDAVGATSLSQSSGRATSASDPAASEGPFHRWRGSSLSLDQSVTTQTLHVGGDFQSSDPVYELWLAAKPQYSLVDRPRDRLVVNAWFNAFLELTNSDSTTTRREPLLGPTFVTAPYVHTLERGLRQDLGYKTSVSVGPRLVLPTDKASWNSGQWMSAGITTSVSQSIPLAGESARLWKGARFVLGLTGGAPWARATTPVDSDLKIPRLEVVANRVLPSDQLRGQMNTKVYLNGLASADVQVMDRLEVSASYVLLNSWAYAPPAAQICTLLTGCATPMASGDATTFRASTWLTLSASYELTRTLGLSVGYYNRATQLGPDGTRRTPFWSPDARFFATLTGSLPDKI